MSHANAGWSGYVSAKSIESGKSTYLLAVQLQKRVAQFLANAEIEIH
jgi:hypothetical protein